MDTYESYCHFFSEGYLCFMEFYNYGYYLKIVRNQVVLYCRREIYLYLYFNIVCINGW